MGRRKLDLFTESYIETALWSSTDDSDRPLDDNFDETDIAKETLDQMIEDCKDFQQANWSDISGDLRRAGHDFWLTRNGHGAGFWDGDWPGEVGRRLTDNSKAYGSVTLYVGDDGKIHGM
jgi:hypothetical protein